MSHNGPQLDKDSICGVGPLQESSNNNTTHSDSFGEDEDIFRGATKEIVFGSIAGMVAEVFEYPFDLAKVRLQAQLLSPAQNASDALRFKGPMDCLMQTWKDEGARGLYRGMSAPLAGSMAVTAALFLSYASFQNIIRKTQLDPKQALSMPQLALAGAGAGSVASFVLTPIELVKCKMQVQMMNLARPGSSSSIAVPGRIPHRSPLPSSTAVKGKGKMVDGKRSYHQAACKVKTASIPLRPISTAPPGAISLVRSIIATHGVRGLWLGHTGTLFRETGGSMAWFIVKEYVARALVERRLGSSGTERTKKEMMPLAWESAVSGAMAGAAGAVVLYPADTVKSAIQTEEEMRGLGGKGKRLGRATTKHGFWRTAMKMYKIHGVRGLYAGCGMTVARAIPSSGIIFVVYDGLCAWFGE
ncbi:L-ornithine transporter [Coprinopsis cinerea okayama7|uniref:L-ornithine transporter n=1 Tax=Coprinopsis cinerea (strain Okayama-7 / 130 / ATCC MYA-4618 / FGSC 9003) TaxID=240176 RepID=A8PCC5_COPC7|nr:L-ornithine transporter [Coprinopsis cinerea okayama7\|eukprot:XP_001840363.2 L-ornithine transporter [Coprinopsis cinerea okayama7\